MSTKAILDKTTNKCKGETGDGRTSWTDGRWLLLKVNCVVAARPAGYGFVDFDSPSSAQKAVTALKSGGVQAQMAKVRTPHPPDEAFVFGGSQVHSVEIQTQL